jgi:hypothetical protein
MTSTAAHPIWQPYWIWFLSDTCNSRTLWRTNHNFYLFCLFGSMEEAWFR